MIRLTILLLLLLPFSVQSENARVRSVTDGDTFVTQDGRKVRMLGINATEREEWFYEEAKNYLDQVIGGKDVRLIKDSKSQDTDKYGRLLRYVEIGTLDVNRELILKGYTYAFLRYPIERKSSYAAAEKQAKRSRVGLWSDARPAETDGPVSEEEEMPIAYTLYGLLALIVLVMIFQTWRYFR